MATRETEGEYVILTEDASGSWTKADGTVTAKSRKGAIAAYLADGGKITGRVVALHEYDFKPVAVETEPQPPVVRIVDAPKPAVTTVAPEPAAA
jgi:hypothetical protein